MINVLVIPSQQYRRRRHDKHWGQSHAASGPIELVHAYTRTYVRTRTYKRDIYNLLQHRLNSLLYSSTRATLKLVKF